MLPGKEAVSAEALTAGSGFWRCTCAATLEKAAGAVKQRLPPASGVERPGGRTTPRDRLSRRPPFRSGRAPAITPVCSTPAAAEGLGRKVNGIMPAGKMGEGLGEEAGSKRLGTFVLGCAYTMANGKGPPPLKDG